MTNDFDFVSQSTENNWEFLMRREMNIENLDEEYKASMMVLNELEIYKKAWAPIRARRMLRHGSGRKSIMDIRGVAGALEYL